MTVVHCGAVVPADPGPDAAEHALYAVRFTTVAAPRGGHHIEGESMTTETGRMRAELTTKVADHTHTERNAA